MLFNSFEFVLFFLPLSLILYWIPRRAGWISVSNLIVLIVSLWFYFKHERNYTYLIAVSIAFNFFMGTAISSRPTLASKLVVLGVAGNLLSLIFFKYFNFILENLRIISPDISLLGRVELPVGISFFTFTQIAYLIDCYRRKVEDYNIVNYGLFVSFFPHLVAGPILHHSEMMPQFSRRISHPILDDLAAGVGMFAIGLFKKTVIADSLAPTASKIFLMAGHGSDLELFQAWTGALAYAGQIYFDFSGYSDMALGIARAFGINLPINFNSPYKAISITDFWRRWHITLSRFLRDYLYIPLGGNRHGRIRSYWNLLVTMLLGGLWHGAAWTFLLWGLIHGVWLALERLISELSVTSRFGGARMRWLGRAVTFSVVVLAWVPFRSPSFDATIRMWTGMVGANGLAIPLDWPVVPAIAASLGLRLVPMDSHPIEIISIVLALACTMIFPNSQQIMSGFRVGLDSPGYAAIPSTSARWRAYRHWVWAIGFGVLLGVSMAFVGGYSEFIYFQF